jgi:tRNA threonylcarbamoyladenosine biosynthesis protein TsaB
VGAVIVLALDTATPSTAVAVLAGAVAVGARHDPEPGARPGHVAEVLPLAVRLLGDAGLALADVDRVAVGTGPGTFTGLRVGVATARALAQGSGAQLVGIPTLRALAAGTGPRPGRVLAVLDARRGEAFAAAYEAGREVVAPAAVAPEALAGLVVPGTLAVGDGAVRFRGLLEPPGAEVPVDGSPLHRIDALTIATLAAEVPANALPQRDAVTPEYGRLPDAELALRQRRP